jgi:cell division protein FtsW
MSMSSTAIADRRRQSLARAQALRGAPRRARTRPDGPPPTAFYVIALVVTIFTVLGLVMVLSASAVRLFHEGESPWQLFSRQATWAVLGAVALWTCARVPLQVWRRFVTPLLVAATVGMFLPLVPGIGIEVNGAKAWVGIGSLSVQPSEFMKLAVVLYCAWLLTARAEEMHVPGRTLVPTAVVAAVASGLCLAQGDLGSAIVLGGIVFAVAFVGGAPAVPLTGLTLAGGLVALGVAVSSERRLNRFLAFRDIMGNRDHLSYQQFQSMVAIAQGGPTGAGPGRGPNNLGDFLPLAHSDFIFAVVVEELGLLGAAAVLGGFLVLTFCGVQVALAANDRFGSLLAGGIVGWFAVQTIVNVGGVTGLMPVTGLTLPFFSAGGSSLFVSMAAAGLLLNVARHAR